MYVAILCLAALGSGPEPEKTLPIELFPQSIAGTTSPASAQPTLSIERVERVTTDCHFAPSCAAGGCQVAVHWLHLEPAYRPIASKAACGEWRPLRKLLAQGHQRRVERRIERREARGCR